MFPGVSEWKRFSALHVQERPPEVPVPFPLPTGCSCMKGTLSEVCSGELGTLSTACISWRTDLVLVNSLITTPKSSSTPPSRILRPGSLFNSPWCPQRLANSFNRYLFKETSFMADTGLWQPSNGWPPCSFYFTTNLSQNVHGTPSTNNV